MLISYVELKILRKGDLFFINKGYYIDKHQSFASERMNLK